MATACHPKMGDSDVRDLGYTGLDSADGYGSPDGHDQPAGGFGSPGDLYRYHRAGNMVLAAGIIGGLVAYSWHLLSAWGGFLAGALPVSIVMAIIQAKQDARRSARSATGLR